MHATRTNRSPIGGKSRHGQLAALLLLISSLLLGAVVHSGSAADSKTLISIGESNSQAQRDELLGYFGNPKDAEITIITIADTQAAMNDIVQNGITGSAYSSAALTCLPLGDGIDVTTINISEVTPAMYAMALVTAGVGDATLIVAAPSDAQAGGLTALTGIFKSWDKVKCDSSQTSPARQKLALRELALTTEISASIGQSTSYAGAFVIDSQRAIVVGGYASEADISAAIANQEAVYNIAVPSDQRAKLVDFMVDLQKQDIDWSTFSAGWTIDYPEATRITMKGDGIAILNAQASATARAGKNLTATARASKDMTATARANIHATQTAAAEAVSAQQTAEAEANLTATALAQPTATATATPLPNDVSGTLDLPISGNQMSVKGSDGTVTPYQIADTATLTRDGKQAIRDDFKKGDTVALKVDAVTNQVVSIQGTAPAKSGTPIAKLLYLLPLLLLIPLGMVLKGRSYGDPFVVKRVARD
jgi:uncharacterized protein YpuA (DUF1002 family)